MARQVFLRIIRAAPTGIRSKHPSLRHYRSGGARVNLRSCRVPGTLEGIAQSKRQTSAGGPAATRTKFAATSSCISGFGTMATAALQHRAIEPAYEPVEPGWHDIFGGAMLLRGKPVSFERQRAIYDVGDATRTLYFLRSGFVKIGTITVAGREVIYDVRKGGDLIGELCLAEAERSDRAVALEQTEAIAIAADEFQEQMADRQSSAEFIAALCASLAKARAHINTLSTGDIAGRLAKVLLNLARTVGQPIGRMTSIPIYLTQEEIAQMVAGRRERTSTALNALRQRGIVHYTARGKLLIDLPALEAVAAE